MPTRRVFLRNSAIAVVGTAAVPSFLTRAAFGAIESGSGPKRLVVIFQRGAADGLNIVVPHGASQYYGMRPSINIPKKSVLDLDGFFGLHPSLAAFQPLWQQRHLAIVHAAGSPDSTRSHFDAQDFMETGTPGVKATEDGWLNRSLYALPKASQTSPFRAMALGPSLPRILSGAEPAVAMNNINDFSIGGRNAKLSPAAAAFEAMYDHSSDSVLHTTGEETFDAVKMLRAADPGKYQPAPGANYPKGRFGDSLRQLALLIKANLGVQVAFTDIGGWDHHVNEGAVEGQLANVLGDFSRSLAAFWTWRSRRRHRRRYDVGVRPHRARKRQPRHRPRPRQRDVRSGRPRERRQSLRPLAGIGSVRTLRRPRSCTDHRLPPGHWRSYSQAHGQSRSGPSLSRLRQSAGEVSPILGLAA